MPYIKQERRAELHDASEWLGQIQPNAIELGYVLLKWVRVYITPSYNNYKNYLGELRQCSVELQRHCWNERIRITPWTEGYNIKSYEVMDGFNKKNTLDELVRLMDAANIKVDGDLNYLLFKYIFGQYHYNRGKIDFITMFAELCEYIEDSILAPYEETMKSNGDV